MINKLKEYKYFIFILFLIVLNFIKLPFYIEMPGGLININNKIDSSINKKLSGSFNMTYVGAIDANVPLYLYSLINKDWDAVKIEKTKSDNETISEKEYRNKLLLEQANSIATIVAYQKAGKNLKINDVKQYVIYIDKQAETDLKIKDEILKVDNKEIKFLTDIKQIISEHNKNDIINIETNNGIKKAKVLEINDIKLIGIMTSNIFDLKSDFSFNFDKSESGPSGGLMMTLTLYNYLLNEDLTNNKIISGTGTIELDGTVGEIDGVKYKLLGAARNKAEVFLVPEKNYDEAIKVKNNNKLKIEIVKIKNIDDAIEYLKKNR